MYNWIYILAFPAWKPDGKRPMCAKFANFYQEKCWNPVIDELKRNTTSKALRGKQKLQCKDCDITNIYYDLC